jgi:hypothetical protein
MSAISGVRRPPLGLVNAKPHRYHHPSRSRTTITNACQDPAVKVSSPASAAAVSASAGKKWPAGRGRLVAGNSPRRSAPCGGEERTHAAASEGLRRLRLVAGCWLGRLAAIASGTPVAFVNQRFCTRRRPSHLSHGGLGFGWSETPMGGTRETVEIFRWNPCKFVRATRIQSWRLLTRCSEAHPWPTWMHTRTLYAEHEIDFRQRYLRTCVFFFFSFFFPAAYSRRMFPSFFFSFFFYYFPTSFLYISYFFYMIFYYYFYCSIIIFFSSFFCFPVLIIILFNLFPLLKLYFILFLFLFVCLLCFPFICFLCFMLFFSYLC